MAFDPPLGDSSVWCGRGLLGLRVKGPISLFGYKCVPSRTLSGYYSKTPMIHSGTGINATSNQRCHVLISLDRLFLAIPGHFSTNSSKAGIHYMFGEILFTSPRSKEAFLVIYVPIY